MSNKTKNTNKAKATKPKATKAKASKTVTKAKAAPEDVKATIKSELTGVAAAPAATEPSTATPTELTVDTASKEKEATPEAPEAQDDMVKTPQGRPLFRRMNSDKAPKLHTKPKEVIKRRPNKKFHRPSGRGNPAALKFPADKWGVTKDIKLAMLAMASRIGGDVNKKDLADETLKVLLDHLEAKFNVDREIREKRKAELLAADKKDPKEQD